ncbi:hypothetical protein [Haloactinospora alba]|nr:hypothetical protein [Haloactinospora alba]
MRAAVELLIDYDDAMWLRRPEFTDRFVADTHPRPPGRSATAALGHPV